MFETHILIYPCLKSTIHFLSIFIISGLYTGVAHILFPSLLAQMKDKYYSISSSLFTDGKMLVSKETNLKPHGTSYCFNSMSLIASLFELGAV